MCSLFGNTRAIMKENAFKAKAWPCVIQRTWALGLQDNKEWAHLASLIRAATSTWSLGLSEGKPPEEALSLKESFPQLSTLSWAFMLCSWLCRSSFLWTWRVSCDFLPLRLCALVAHGLGFLVAQGPRLCGAEQFFLHPCWGILPTRTWQRGNKSACLSSSERPRAWN